MAEFLVIHIPDNVEPLDRGDRFEDPLDKALAKAGKLGECVGGGTAFETEPTFRITGCDIEVEVTDLAKALPVIQKTLIAANAPPGTTVTHPDTERVLLRFTKTGVKEAAPAKKPRKKRFVDNCPWEPGTVLAYKLTRNRYVLLHVYGFGGLGPMFWIPEWSGNEIPSAAEIRRLIRQKPKTYRLGSVFEAWREKEEDRNDSRLVETGVTVPLPKNGQRGWFPGTTSVRLWPEFEQMLKEVLGLVKVKPAVRLNHDLGFVDAAVHLAVWHPTEPMTPKAAKQWLYSNTRQGKRAGLGSYDPPVTNALKTFVTELKSEADGEGVFLSSFSAEEGFVIMSVARKKAAGVWTVAAKLARQHGVACYHSETEEVVQPQQMSG